LSAIFEGLDQPLNIAGQVGENASGSSASNNNSHVEQQQPQQPMIVGSIPLVVPELPHARSWPKPNEEQDLRVYSQRPRIEEQGEHHAEEQGELQVVEADMPEERSIGNTMESLDFPIALRKGTRVATLKEISRYGLVHNINKYLSYEALSLSYKAFVASL
jgi:hypothetical protein